MTALLSFIEALVLESELSQTIVNITAAVLQEHYFHTIAYISSEELGTRNAFNTDLILRDVSSVKAIPILRLRDEQIFSIRRSCNKNILSIARLNGNMELDRKLLKTLWLTLKKNTQSRLILLLHDNPADKHDDTESYVKQLLQYCVSNKAMHTIVILSSVLVNSAIYTATLFPSFQLKIVESNFAERQNFFEDHTKNLYGQPLRLIFSNVEPKSYFYKNSEGKNIFSGYIGNLFVEYAYRRNATLVFPLLNELNELLFVGNMDLMVENGTVDASAGTTYDTGLRQLSYTAIYEYSDWCVMLPVEAALPSYMFYIVIFDGYTLLLCIVALVVISFSLALAFRLHGQRGAYIKFVFNADMLNGLLGQSFLMERRFAGVRSAIYIITSLAGVIFNTTYVTYLQSFNARAPTQAAITTIKDLQHSGLKIAMYREEAQAVQMLNDRDVFQPLVHVINDYKEYYKLRDSFDKRFAYPASSAKWIFYEQIQKFFSKPRFRLSDICYIKNLGLSLPLQENSLYQQSLDTLIGSLKQAGLIMHWQTRSFLELVQLGRLKLFDISEVHSFEPMKLEDLYLMLAIFGMALIPIILCFVLELLWRRLRELCGM